MREEPIYPEFRAHGLSPSLLATNTTILHEAGSLLYGQNQFNLASWDEEFALQFLDDIGSVNASHLQCICIDLPRFRNLNNEINMEDESLRTLEKIQSDCTNLQKLIISAEDTADMENQFYPLNGQEVYFRALALVDAGFRAIPSLREVIAEVYEGEASSDITMIMQSHGWIVNVMKEVQGAEWEIDRSPDDYESDEYTSDHYDTDDHIFESKSEFWRRVAD